MSLSWDPRGSEDPRFDLESHESLGRPASKLSSFRV